MQVCESQRERGLGRRTSCAMTSAPQWSKRRLVVPDLIGGHFVIKALTSALAVGTAGFELATP